MWRKVVNFAGFQVGWFACILAAAAGRPLVGPAVVAGVTAVHLALAPRRAGELALLAAAAGYGYLADSALVLADVLGFPEEARLGGPSPVWMVALWVNLAATLHSSLAWLLGRWWLGAALGAVAGPLTYLAGVRLGAARFDVATTAGLAVVGVEWVISMPVLLWLASRTAAAAGEAAP